MGKLLAALACWTLCAHASATGSWVPVFTSGYYMGQATYNNRSAALNEQMTAPAQLYALSVRVNSYYGRIKSDINSNLAAQLSTAGASFVSGALTGDISLVFQGGAGSRIDMTLSGPSYTGVGRGSKSGLGGLLEVTCTTTLRLSSISATASYDWNTGVVSSLRDVRLNPSQSTSCSSNIDWIPVVGDLLTDYVEGRVGQLILSKINGWVSQISQSGAVQGPSYLGVETAIGYGQYVASGFDIGAYIKNNFPNLFIGKSVQIVLGDPAKYTVVSDRPYVGQTRTRNYLQADFSDSVNTVRFALTSRSDYRYEWRCPIGTSNCQEP